MIALFISRVRRRILQFSSFRSFSFIVSRNSGSIIVPGETALSHFAFFLSDIFLVSRNEIFSGLRREICFLFFSSSCGIRETG